MWQENQNKVLKYQNKLKQSILAQIRKNNQAKQSSLLNKDGSINSLSKQTKKISFNRKKRNKMFNTQLVFNQKVTPSFLIPNQNHINTLNIDAFQLGQFLGRGINCSAHIARHKATGFFCCIKIINRQKIQVNLEKFINSLKIQIYVNHPNVAKTYGIMIDNTKVYLIMELCQDGDLSVNLKQIKKDQNKCQQSIKEIVRGLKYLHEHSLQHRDLKLQNLLISFDVVKISDFDLTVYYQYRRKQTKRSTLCGSPLYFSPQMLQNHCYDKVADIWCLGIISYELICGFFPFQIKNNGDLKKIILDEIKYPQNIKNEAKDFLSKLLVKNPQKRMSFNQILRHPFLCRQNNKEKNLNIQIID